MATHLQSRPFPLDTAQDAPLPVPDHDEPQPDLLLYRPGTANEEHLDALFGVG